MKNVLITGGTRGIGAECARLFFQNGYRVFLIYRENDKCAEEIKKQTGAYIFKADISDKAMVEKVIDEIVNICGKIDVLVNNAGIAQQKLFLDVSQDDWDNMINVNLGGVYNVTRKVLENMVKQNSGSIINVSSIWGECGASCEVHYSAAKAGVIGLTKALAKEMGLSNIRVNCVAPGIIDTQMNDNLSKEDILKICDEIPLNRVGKAHECAELIYFLASEKSSYITGQVIGINGGWNI